MNTNAHRFFAAAPAQYEAARAAIDSAMGFPSGRAETAFSRFSEAIKDATGRGLVAVRGEWLAGPEGAALLSLILAHAEEITAADYSAAQTAAADSLENA